MSNHETLDVVGVVLAGGESRRFGSDKASALLAGRPLLQWVVEALAGVCVEVVVVAAPGQQLPISGSFTILRDGRSHLGPLAGLVTAFGQLQGRTVLVASCDAPLLQPALLRTIAERLRTDDAVCAVVGERLQPFPAALRVDACLRTLSERFARGERSLISAIESLSNLKRVDAEDLRPVDADLRSFASANTAAELAGIGALLSGN